MLAWLASCAPPPPAAVSATGSVQLAVHLPDALSGDVSRITVTVSGGDMPSRSIDLALSRGAWGGVLGDLPAGAHRTFLAQAFNASNTLRFEGRAEDVSITAGARGLVSLTLQDVSAPVPFSNEVPVVDSLVASPATVAPGGSVSLSASVHDPNAGDSVSYAWSAPSGSFSAPTQATTTWTAPGVQGPVRLTLTLSDSHGAALSVNLTLDVSRGRSGAEVTVDFLVQPRIVTLTSSQSLLNVGQQTALSVSTTGALGSTWGYQWSATCAGSFTGQGTASATFIPSALPEAACNNCQVSVQVTDGYGGQTQGSLDLCVSPPVIIGPAWTFTDSMVRARVNHQTTLLSTGRVLASGGDTLATAEVYNPYTNLWSATGPMVSPRKGHTETLLPSGKVLVTGGLDENNNPLATAEVYDPTTNTWSPAASMIAPRYAHTATLLPTGKVLVLGGTFGTQITSELYDPASGTWSPSHPPAVERTYHTATLMADGRVLVAGGFDGDYNVLASVELYEPYGDAWSSASPMTTARIWHAAVAQPWGTVLVSGGYGFNGYLATAELYDPYSNTWSPVGSMTRARSSHRQTALPTGEVLVSGGEGGTSRTTVELYDPYIRTWSPFGQLSRSRNQHAALLLPNRRMLFSGGAPLPDPTGAGDPAELYIP